MAKLKLGTIQDDKPVKLTIEVPADTHRDLIAYADMLTKQTGQVILDPSKLIVPMVKRFITSDRVFRRLKIHKAETIDSN